MDSIKSPIITFSGIVIHGKELGRTIGYRTANIALPSGTMEDGVYALKIQEDKIWYKGVGTYRESIELFEAHIFDFDKDIYDETLEIQVVEKIRDNQKFNSLEELKEQIKKDAEKAKELF